MSDSIDRIFSQIDFYRGEVISLQQELTSRVALGPVNGGSGEHEKTTYIEEIIRELKPAELEQVNAPDPKAESGYRPNLVALWDGKEDLPRLWILSHSDIVPPGDLSLWQSDPYQVRVEGDKIYGRGVEDNQHGIVSSILAVRAIIDSGLKPLRPIGIAIVADEETGSRYGLCYLLEKRRELFRDTDLIVVPDGGNETGTMIEVAEKSILWVRFTVLGKQCHASTPHKGKNSLTAAARLIVALEKIRENFDERDELFSPPISTFEPTKMEANVENVNTIPGKDVFYMDCRILPRFEVETVLERCREIAGEVSESLSVEIKVDIAHKEDAAPPTAADAPVVKSLSRAIRLVTGREARPMGIGGGTVAAFFRKAGLPAAVWCTSPDTAHQPNEYCLIPDILTDAKVFAAMAMEA
ncbi:MAG: diaminopimelate aminotransferase [Deltaproteobacteria bacterium]|nr:MAG: diaminopimelate aminotransferase [Deltaproteobacteria bacterium]